MNDAPGNLTSLATLVGCGLSLLGVENSSLALALTGVALSATSASSVLLGVRRQRQTAVLTTNIGALNLDSLHLANLRRRMNKSLRVERAFQVAIIDGSDLHLAWQYDGSCKASTETEIEFSIDSENNVPFEQLQCFAFDLQSDPARLSQIRPTLIGSDGISKKVSVPLLNPLKENERYSVLFHCTLPACITTGVQYYTSSLSFDQQAVDSSSVHLIFVKSRPKWMHVYELNKSGRPTFLHELRPFRDDGATCEYVDMAQKLPGQFVRVYVYDLPALGGAMTGFNRASA